ncbi:MAG: type I 3-dehydroquinate dehydratase [Verrucomicrobiaceae bacterium]|nr:MAG: type I 3-dehydroquinate dehydratase [Verrucomicrobiaceae bacterium]
MKKSIFLEQANIVIPIVDEHSLEKISSTKKLDQCNVIEIRIDLLMSVPDLKQKISKINAPILLTCRHPDEGGPEEFRDSIKRQSVITPLIQYASALDIEIDQAEHMKSILELAKSEGLLTLLSFHDFIGTPEKKHLQNKVSEGYERGADVVKIATTTNSFKDIISLMTLFDLFDSHHLSVMGMGRLGMASRLLAAQSGSVLNYAALQSASVPGQWEVNDFKKILKAANEM